MERPVSRVLLVAGVIGLMMSCKTQDGSSSQEPAPKSSTTPSKVGSSTTVAEPAKDEHSAVKASEKLKAKASPQELSSEERKRLKLVFDTLWCLQSKNERTGISPVLKKEGYESISAWADAWHKASQIDPAWVDSVVAAVNNVRCGANTR